nr:unnamed protein product [Spirometra erinaceieuropaei]
MTASVSCRDGDRGDTRRDLQTAEGLAGFANPASQSIVDLGGAGEDAAQANTHLRDDEEMVGPPVCTRDRLCHQHVPLITPPDEDIVRQVPLTRPRMPPDGLLSLRQTEVRVRQDDAVFCADAEEEQAVVVEAAETIGT